MLDIKFVRANPSVVREDLEKRQDKEKLSWLDELLDADAQYRKLTVESEALRAGRNVATKAINEAIKSKKSPSEIDGLKIEAAQIPRKIKQAEEKTRDLEEKIRFYLMRLPNILHESVPFGKDESGNKVLRAWGKVRKLSAQMPPHGEWLEKNGLAEFSRAAKISGAGFYFLKGDAALLELALQRFAIDSLSKKGFTPVTPPFMMSRAAYEGVTSLDDFEKVMYKIDGHDAYLIATSEHPLTAMYKDEVIGEENLPIQLCGVSTCFRREIGAHGLDTKGIFRVHQFNKVEQIVLCKPQDSWEWHEKMQANAEEFFQKLDIPHQVVSICTGDIGIVAAKKYDVEAWMPREQKYREVTSASNCTGYQAARLNIKYRIGKQGSQDERKEFVHTLNATAIATSRALRAVIENHMQEDGTVSVPKALLPYMNGIESIGKKTA
ncbi:serine--tRNA ligase [Candidatus Micrarchaeota archaeon]|nr:serine--tRNA ligase [Candidatus Micrarchaeota archaeon]